MGDLVFLSVSVTAKDNPSDDAPPVTREAEGDWSNRRGK
jgi:hypothetical protein